MTIDRGTTRPPQWAESLLRLLLKPHDRDSVSGDLLEEYREGVVPMRGSRQADVWYLRQVAGVVWQVTWLWALVFSGTFIVRTMYDWFVPTTHFAVRAAVSTWAGAGTLLFASAWGSWRSRSVGAGLVIAVVTSQIAALITVAGAALLLAVWHDPDTLRAIAGSGGLEEVFVLPFYMIIPAVIVGSAGDLVGALVARLYAPSSANTTSA